MAPEIIGEENKELNNNGKPKTSKDFTPEEAEKILARVKEIGLGKAAQEAGISTAVIISLRRKAIIKAALEERSIAASTPIPLSASSASEVDETPEEEKPIRIKTSKDFTTEEKLMIIDRAKFVGANQAAREAGISTSMIYNWTFQLKPTQATKGTQTYHTAIINQPREEEKTTQQEQKTAIKEEQIMPITQETPTETNKAFIPETQFAYSQDNTKSNLELENAILKEKVRYLTEQAERLKIAVTALMGGNAKYIASIIN